MTAEIENMLLESGNGTSIALCGLGGVGKSALAGAVALMPEVEQFFSDGTFWFDLQITDAMTALDRIGCTFGFDVSAYTTVQSRAQAVRTVLRDKNVLLVLDNVWDVDRLSPLLPQSPTVCALVTTRDEGIGSDLCEDVVLLNELTEDQGIHLLSTLVGAETAEQSREVCGEITRFLEHLPLAVELVGKRLRRQARRPGFSWEGSLATLKEAGGLDLSSRDRSLRATFASSYEALGDDGRALFQRIGYLDRGDIELGVIATAMAMDEDVVREQLETLIDLSVLRPLTATRYGIHSLLHDYAREKSNEIPEDVHRTAAGRIADYFFDRAQHDCLAPGSVDDIRPVLRSYHYAVAAGDKKRAERVFPWFGDLAIPGFLKQHGHHLTLLEMQEDQRTLAVDDLEIAYGEWNLGEGYMEVGRYEEAILHLSTALELYKNDEYDIMIAKLSYLLGQAYASVGDSQNSIVHFEQAIEVDRKMGNTAGIGLTMVQIGDLYDNEGDHKKAWDYYKDAREFGEQNADPRSEVIALIRLGEMTRQTDPERAIEFLNTAVSLDVAKKEGRLGSGERVEITSTAFSGWDGARLLVQIGNIYQNLLFNGNDVLKKTASCYWRASNMAKAASSPFYESIALYGMGQLMEHLFLVPDMKSDLPAALACYERSDELSKNMQLPPGINPRERIETRILPRIEKEGGAASVTGDFNAVIEASVKRLLEHT